MSDWCIYCGEDMPNCEIILENGDCLDAHERCLIGAIRDNVNAGNPVHSIVNYETQEELFL